MDQRELENACLLTAVSLLDGATWDVHKEEDDLLIFVDSLRPDAYPSARVLGAYLRELQQVDAATVDLPSSPEEYVGPTVEP